MKRKTVLVIFLVLLSIITAAPATAQSKGEPKTPRRCRGRRKTPWLT